MHASDYQQLAMRTAAPESDNARRLINAALGLTGEAGEFADTVKKIMFHGHTLDQPALINELGDVLWYVAQACTALDIDMSAVMEANVAKLRRRYPDGFSSDRSIQRDE